MVELKEGEVACSRCDGTGLLYNGMCEKCQGNGKLDWIEQILGKKPLFWEQSFKDEYKQVVIDLAKGRDRTEIMKRTFIKKENRTLII